MKSDLEAALVTFLNSSDHYPPPAHYVRHIETHISHVFLTGEYAYKLKKPVAFDFVDFTTLEKRKYFCEEEIRLNSRFAPELYLEVIPFVAVETVFPLAREARSLNTS